MSARLALALAVLAALAGCASRTQAPLGISGTIAVLPVNNRTGEPLLVEGSSLIDRYVRHAGRVSVGDVLQSEARHRLQQQGFEVGDWSSQQGALKGGVPASRQDALELARRSGLKGRLLYLEIRRWEPDAPTHTRFVIVGIGATVIDAATGVDIWHEDRRAAPVATPGSINLESAYVIAARKVIAEMLAPLRPAPDLR